MPYFSNSTEGEMWQAANCEKGCIHNVEEPPGCPIMAVSFAFNYGQCSAGANAQPYSKGVADGKKAVLEALVPTGDDGFAQDCPFFKQAP